MYSYFDGIVAEKSNNELVIDVNGVGYSLMCSVNTLQAAPPVGDGMKCYAYLSVREDAMELFGFATKSEKAMFMRLCTVSGIGSRTALSVLGSMPLQDLNLAIVMGDLTALSRAPGIGKKTAQRIALELKDKVSEEDFSMGGKNNIAMSDMPKESGLSEAMQALQALGYTAIEASKALQSVKDKSDKPDELIKLALRAMAGM